MHMYGLKNMYDSKEDSLQGLCPYV